MSGVTCVLGGGAVGRSLWETGMLAGLLDEGVAVDSADLLLGTSAGAVDAAFVRATTRR
jgi:NTE family protein